MRLYELRLNFCNVSSFDNEKLEMLGNVLKKRTELKVLTLNIMECDRIDDSGIQGFLKSLGKI